jgi:type IV secretory pathway TraG/TraD family ATPase VirD4
MDYHRLSRFLLMAGVQIVACTAAAAGIATFPWSLLGLGYGLYRKRHKIKLWGHGTARVATRDELLGMINAEEGLFLGELAGKPSLSERIAGLFDSRLSDQEACGRFFGEREIVRLATSCHVGICAPTRSGKGVSLCVPFLKTLRPSASVCVLDYKPELAALTAMDMAARGFEIILLDPTHALKGKLPFPVHTLNFLDFLRTINDCRALAKELVPRDGESGGNSEHFLGMAEKVIGSEIALACHYGKGADRSLQKVQDIVSSKEALKKSIEVMRKTGGILARMGGQLEFLEGEEAGGVGTTISRKMQWLDSLEMLKSTLKTSWDVKSLRRGGKAVFIIPGGVEYARVLTPWVRACIGTIARTVMKQPLGEEHKIHVIFDEAPLLSHMDVVDDLLDKGAGWGFRCQWYFQNRQQISKCFPKQELTFLSNVTQVFFAVNDMESQAGRGTAEYISARGGDATILEQSGGETGGGQTGFSEGGKDRTASRNSSWGWSRNWSTKPRKLWTADEVMAADKRMCFTFMPAKRPLLTRLIRWHEEPALMSGARPTSLRTLVLSGALLLAVCLGATLVMKAAFSFPRTHISYPKGGQR